MSFLSMETRLLQDFDCNRNVWHDYVNKNKKNTHSKIFAINTAKKLYITYPGYKTTLKKGGNFVYDYRVNYQGYAVSHPSIIIDLYNKAMQYPQYAKRLKEFLIVLSQKGDSINLNYFADLLSLEYVPPTNEILDIANHVFTQLNKQYLIAGNLAWNFSFSDLSTLIPWISLQEDINYPMSIGHYQGRMMPFYRYIEAVFCGISKDRNSYSLDKVIERALVHYQPELWHSIDYSKITQLKTIYQKLK